MNLWQRATFLGWLLAAMLVVPQPSAAQSCGVLPFTGEGVRVNDKILVKLTSMFTEELSNREGCTSTTEHRAGDIEADCLTTGRCLKKWAKDEGHKYLFTATVADAELDHHIRIRVSLFERSKGTYTATATRVIMASKESLVQALPSITAEVLGEPEPVFVAQTEAVASNEPDKLSVPRATSRATVEAPPEPEPVKETRTHKSTRTATAEPEVDKAAGPADDAVAVASTTPAPAAPRGPDPAASCGVLQFTGGGNRVNAETLNSLTALAASEIDIQGRFDITMEYATSDYSKGCAASTNCLAKFATANGHGRLAVATVSDGKSGTIHLKLRLYDPDNGSWERTVEEDLPADRKELMIEMPPLVTELLTGERPMTAVEVMAQQEEDDIKLDFDMDVFSEIEEEEEEDLMVFGEEESFEFMDMEMTAEERKAKQEEARMKREAEDRIVAEDRWAKEQERLQEETAAQDRQTSISIEEDEEDEETITIENADEYEIIIE